VQSHRWPERPHQRHSRRPAFIASDMLRYLKANMGVDGSPLTAAFVGSQCPLSAHPSRSPSLRRESAN